MTDPSPPPAPGQIARVRQRLYLVEQAISSRASRDSTLVRLSCLDDDNQGQPLEVLWERELDPEILTAEAWDQIAHRGFDQPRLFAAYFSTLRRNCVTATDPRLFQAPFRAGIQLDAFQLEPLRKALLLPRVNLFIADDDQPAPNQRRNFLSSDRVSPRSSCSQIRSTRQPRFRSVRFTSRSRVWFACRFLYQKSLFWAGAE